MQKATLREAVLLSVGLEPHAMRQVQSGYAPPEFADPGREFQRRMTLARNYLSEKGPLRPLVLMEMLGSPDNVHVGLAHFRAWADGMGWPMPERFPAAEAPATAPMTQAEQVPAVVDGEWKELAQETARGIIKRQAAKNLYPPQQDIADEIASEFRKRGIFSEDGKPLTGATIKRHALRGISSATKKALSTVPKRGK